MQKALTETFLTESPPTANDLMAKYERLEKLRSLEFAENDYNKTIAKEIADLQKQIRQGTGEKVLDSLMDKRYAELKRKHNAYMNDLDTEEPDVAGIAAPDTLAQHRAAAAPPKKKKKVPQQSQPLPETKISKTLAEIEAKKNEREKLEKELELNNNYSSEEDDPTEESSIRNIIVLSDDDELSEETTDEEAEKEERERVRKEKENKAIEAPPPAFLTVQKISVKPLEKIIEEFKNTTVEFNAKLDRLLTFEIMKLIYLPKDYEAEFEKNRPKDQIEALKAERGCAEGVMKVLGQVLVDYLNQTPEGGYAGNTMFDSSHVERIIEVMMLFVNARYMTTTPMKNMSNGGLACIITLMKSSKGEFCRVDLWDVPEEEMRAKNLEPNITSFYATAPWVTFFGHVFELFNSHQKISSIVAQFVKDAQGRKNYQAIEKGKDSWAKRLLVVKRDGALATQVINYLRDQVNYFYREFITDGPTCLRLVEGLSTSLIVGQTTVLSQPTAPAAKPKIIVGATAAATAAAKKKKSVQFKDVAATHQRPAVVVDDDDDTAAIPALKLPSLALNKLPPRKA